MTDNELLEAYRNEADPEKSAELLREINTRINRKAKQKHPADCQCVDCNYDPED